ncbi:MAG: ubiquinol-cytochrome c reductase iron-sulfur subunit [Actinobacteria bacterium]|nr:ubiquinol-cytochrome c reductase iron-sulfur subunit [Actinomycetota bacterium]MBU1494387.1 ubiquinol-cytochrome c reductase iron-sulfur subunit [Actinomycetota bacterium]MBU1865967.1 ubiquinol-cytochrome c reductase iron-sulfur subunit [Actinomycetota bacterium]
MDRRKFLSRATVAIAAAIGIGWAVPGVAYVLSPAKKKTGEAEWIVLGAADRVDIGTPSLFKAKVTKTSGWVSTEAEVAVYVVTHDGREFRGFSNVCTHLGCRVRWVADQNEFFCPCHNGVFSVDGQVVAGPPPRGLDEFPVKVEDGQIFVSLEA